MPARDLVRSGRPCLDRGRIGREPVIPAGWIDRIHEGTTRTGRDGPRRGHGEPWRLPGPGAGLPGGACRTWGLANRAVLVVAARDRVVRRAHTMEFRKRLFPAIRRGDDAEDGLLETIRSCRRAEKPGLRISRRAAFRPAREFGGSIERREALPGNGGEPAGERAAVAAALENMDEPIGACRDRDGRSRSGRSAADRPRRRRHTRRAWRRVRADGPAEPRTARNRRAAPRTARPACPPRDRRGRRTRSRPSRRTPPGPFVADPESGRSRAPRDAGGHRVDRVPAMPAFGAAAGKRAAGIASPTMCFARSPARGDRSAAAAPPPDGAGPPCEPIRPPANSAAIARGARRPAHRRGEPDIRSLARRRLRRPSSVRSQGLATNPPGLVRPRRTVRVGALSACSGPPRPVRMSRPLAGEVRNEL